MTKTNYNVQYPESILTFFYKCIQIHMYLKTTKLKDETIELISDTPTTSVFVSKYVRCPHYLHTLDTLSQHSITLR